ncbi:carboxypeptidase-like regulatory domain-containing protein [Planctomicrobium sp. SH668]|uniref:carboxypeptidase-like regulatory domain-containing protein n=1 Tax=Planctomicrobium sp. SH668 TaxID=3448126 RepID=UPI003F5BE208
MVVRLLNSGLFSLMVCVGLSLSGCQKGFPDGFTGERGTVTGVVTLDKGALPAGCQVLFISNKGGYTGAGKVDDQGKFSVLYPSGPGLPVGDYDIQLTAPVEISSGNAVSTDPTAMAKTLKLGPRPTGKPATPFPSKYASTGTSGLKFTVKSGENTANFNLEGK